MNGPSGREEQILTLINRYVTEYDQPPGSKWLAEQFLHMINPNLHSDNSKRYQDELSAARKNLMTIIGRMVKKGFVERKDGIIFLTEKAKNYFLDKQEAVSSVKSVGVIPTQVKVLGHVRAGRVNEHDLDIEISDTPDETIAIPDVGADRKTYALKVEGQSMEHEGIFEGDYVIVEEYFSYEWPKEGDLIVTKYLELPKYLMNDPDLDLEDFELSGHTLKIYSEIQDKGKRYYRLSWKKDNLSNPYLIKAVRLRPVGKVIGVYRSIR